MIDVSPAELGDLPEAQTARPQHVHQRTMRTVCGRRKPCASCSKSQKPLLDRSHRREVLRRQPGSSPNRFSATAMASTCRSTPTVL